LQVRPFGTIHTFLSWSCWVSLIEEIKMMDYKFVMLVMVNDIFAGFKTLSIQLNRFTYIKESKQPKWLGN